MKRLILDNVAYYNETISYRSIKGINATFESGKFYSIVTDKMLDVLLLSILLGLEEPTSGNVIYNETILDNRDDFYAYQKCLGKIIVKEGLLKNLKVIKNYEIILSKPKVSDRMIKQKINQIFDQYKIDKQTLNKKVRELKDEELNEVLFVLAITNDPEIIIINDSFPSIINNKKVLKWLLELCEEKKVTVILLSQDFEVSNIGNELWRFSEGRLNFVRDIENK